MPLINAQKHQWTKQPPYNFYHFPEEHRANWEAFWKEMDGEIDKVLEFAKKADIECPKEWYESLHRFLFLTFSGNPKLLKTSANSSFGSFLTKVAEGHKEEKKDKEWYSVRGVTYSQFIRAMESAAEIKDIRQAVGYINARIKDLGFYLYSEFILSKTKEQSKIKSVASNKNKEAYALECTALGFSPLAGLEEGMGITHCLFPDDKFMVIEVVAKADAIDMVVTRDTDGRIAFIKDVWNIDVM